ncbi:oxidoreductase [Marinobacter sp.]|uniref:oxidoreductase n=1 Tax=Marinobacter sp. TaxID=50741 RepID=UPI0035679425
MNVMVLGATGLTGHLVVQQLLAREVISKVVVPVRKPMSLEHPKLDQHVVDFDDLTAHADIFAVDALICCLGTTIKKAGSQDNFRKVDFSYALAAAKLAREQGATSLILMSAIGASSSSTIFYNRVKGELEDAVRDLDFPYLSIYHPSLLLGDRQEHRGGEELGQMAMPLVNRVLIGPLDKYRAIKAETVAEAMVNEVCGVSSEEPAERVVQIREYPDIVALAG